ncbi:MAG: hypothetical protein KF832_27315 [Caldilineaceae bacterium]|nr:hypothetical protein [Caldilineaceae bacterium]
MSTTKLSIDTKLIPPFLVLLLVFVLPSLVVTWVFAGSANIQSMPSIESVSAYPAAGALLDSTTFVQELPPPPLDALPYDVREPLVNGASVPVKKRWLWVPSGEHIAVSTDESGQAHVTVPLGTKWWKEFYMLTDRGTYLIERRIIERVFATPQHPNGWAYYSAHYVPAAADFSQPLVFPSTGDIASAFSYQAMDWLPTQVMTRHIEVQFEDVRGVKYSYVFPGQTQCVACHQGASGAYLNGAVDSIEVFGLHPQNLTAESVEALVARGWLVGAEALLPTMTNAAEAADDPDTSFTQVHEELLAVIRNNCASCHNGSPLAAASFTAFVVDPNVAYSPAELLAIFSQSGKMFADANPLVTPGSLEKSEIYLRLTGSEGRRRMPPIEGGLPEPDPHMVNLFATWIQQVDQP